MTARLLAAVALLIPITSGIRAALPTGELRDYGSFIASGRAAVEGKNPYGIHPLTFHVVLADFEVWNPNLNPPVSVPAFAALGRIEPQRGFRLWWIFSLGCYLTAVALLARRTRSWILPLWALALAGFWDTLALGQIYLPLVLAAVAAWLLLERGRMTAAGLLIGVVVAVKPNFAVWPALLLLAGHRRAAATSLGTAAALSLVPLLLYGGSIYARWLEVILSDEHRAAFLTNASFSGLAQRLGATAAGRIASALLLVTLAVWATRARPDPLRASSLGILGGVAASPIAWVHYTLFLLPLFFRGRLNAALLVSAALLVVPVGWVLRLLDAPAWQQATAGSAYNWAVLLCLAGIAGARMNAVATPAPAPTLVFYDGLCGLCDRFVYFLVSRDRRGVLRFAQLQGGLARRELVPAGHDPADLDSVFVIARWGTSEQRVLSRSRAVLHALAQLGGVWAVLAGAARLVPRPLADAGYDLVARRRYRIFGRFEACPLPRPEWRNRFVDTPQATR